MELSPLISASGRLPNRPLHATCEDARAKGAALDRTPMRTMVSALIATALAMPVSVGAQSGLSLCEQFRQHLNERGGSELQPLEEVDHEDGNLKIPGLDIDGDKVE